jgi:hypothetical protein
VTDLVRVAQFVAIMEDEPMAPKEEMQLLLQRARTPDFGRDDEPHGLLAELPLPIYVTTNYDDFMLQAMRSRTPPRNAQREICRWNQLVRQEPSVLTEREPKPEQPVIYHLHGCLDLVDSMVLTEDDYLDFIVKIWRDSTVIPPRLERALAGASLVFIGYSLSDWNFRVLFQGLVGSVEDGLRRTSVTVQLEPSATMDEVIMKDGNRLAGRVSAPDDTGITVETEALGSVRIPGEHVHTIRRATEMRAKQQAYLEKYFEKLDMKVFWGTARDFTLQLRGRWQEFRKNRRDLA